MPSEIKIVDVTEEQLSEEQKVQDIVELYASKDILENKANKEIGSLLKSGLKEGIFSRGDIHNYNNRRDRKESEYGQRSHIQFAMDLRRWNDEEKKTFQHFIFWMKEVQGKDDITYKSWGSDDNGYVMIANFDTRWNSPNRPDYKAWWNSKENNVEVKNFGKKIWLKIPNLEKYREWDSYIAMGFNGAYLLFQNGCAAYFLGELPYPPVKVRGKKSVVITPDGHNAHFSLKRLMNMGVVISM